MNNSRFDLPKPLQVEVIRMNPHWARSVVTPLCSPKASGGVYWPPPTVFSHILIRTKCCGFFSDSFWTKLTKRTKTQTFREIALLTIFKNIEKHITLTKNRKQTLFTKSSFSFLTVPSTQTQKNHRYPVKLYFSPFSKTYAKPSTLSNFFKIYFTKNAFCF